MRMLGLALILLSGVGVLKLLRAVLHERALSERWLIEQQRAEQRQGIDAPYLSFPIQKCSDEDSQ